MKKKTMLDTIRKYNQRVQKKIIDMKEDNQELLEQRRRNEETFDNETYMSGIGVDQIVHCQYLMNVISYYHSLNHQFKEFIQLKNQVNKNDGKIIVLKAILGLQTESSPGKGSKTDSEPKEIFSTPKDVSTGTSSQGPSLSELEGLIEAAEVENARITNSITTTQVRNKTLGNELTKTLELNRAKKLEDIEKAIEEQNNEIADIKAEIEMVSS